MFDLRCQCGHKIAEYTDTEIRIMDKKCKSVTVLTIADGKLKLVGSGPIEWFVPIGTLQKPVRKKCHEPTNICFECTEKDREGCKFYYKRLTKPGSP